MGTAGILRLAHRQTPLILVEYLQGSPKKRTPEKQYGCPLFWTTLVHITQLYCKLFQQIVHVISNKKCSVKC